MASRTPIRFSKRQRRVHYEKVDSVDSAISTLRSHPNTWVWCDANVGKSGHSFAFKFDGKRLIYADANGPIIPRDYKDTAAGKYIRTVAAHFGGMQCLSSILGPRHAQLKKQAEENCKLFGGDPNLGICANYIELVIEHNFA